MKHIIWTADERSNRRKILAVSTQLKQLRKESQKKIQAWTGFKPMTSAMPVQKNSGLNGIRTLELKIAH